MTPILPPDWQGRERDATPPDLYRQRRAFLKTAGLGAIGLAAAPFGCGSDRAAAVRAARPTGPLATIPETAPRDGLPAPRNPAYTVEGRGLTERELTATYNNFYEFDGSSKEVWPLTGLYEPFPWTLRVSGLVEQPLTFDLTNLIRQMPLEERVYRHRCVEAWSMVVPWSGFPLKALIDRCRPLSSAQYVRFVSADRPREMPGIPGQPWYEWPYYEALRMDEATNELAFVATGLYGEPLPKQNGSPLHVILPWKYGYKGPKAVVALEFVRERPNTFWNDLQPQEYGFLSNVNPNIPHPRWTQATERPLGYDRKIPTLLFNGYGEWVAGLYPDEPTTPQPPTAR